MRVIEPRNKSMVPGQPKKTKPTRKKKASMFGLFCLLVIGGSIYSFIINPNNTNTLTVDVSPGAESQSIVEVQEPKKTGSREFSGNEFRLLFDNILLPNTEKVELPPFITGDSIADARIRQIAELRGYKLRRNSSGPLVNVDGYPMQEPAKQPWEDLKNSAKQDGKIMSIVSGFRDINEQRILFLSKLETFGVKTSEIVVGNVDEDIDRILVTVSIPGYSKHHTGYVFDLLCAGWSFENFKDSNCHDWLSNNNYENAKKFGFIPSYPLDADLQGPDPEAWEYVYIGTDILNH